MLRLHSYKCCIFLLQNWPGIDQGWCLQMYDSYGGHLRVIFMCFTFWTPKTSSPTVTFHHRMLQQIGIVRSSIASIRLRVREAEPHSEIQSSLMQMGPSPGEVTTWFRTTLPETNSASWHLKIGFPKRKGSSPNHPLSGAMFQRGEVNPKSSFLESFLIFSGQFLSFVRLREVVVLIFQKSTFPS